MAQAQAMGHRVIYSVSENSLKTEAQTLNILCRAKVDGILWEPVSSASLSLKNIPEKAGTPTSSSRARGPLNPSAYAATP